MPTAWSLHSEVEMPAQPGVVSLACPIMFTNDPAANPYWIHFAWALALLLGVFILWRRIRPRGRPLLRWYAGVGGIVAFVVMQAQACAHFERAARDSGCRLVLEASLFVAASLLLEILLSLRRPSLLSRAVARVRTRRDSLAEGARPADHPLVPEHPLNQSENVGTSFFVSGSSAFGVHAVRIARCLPLLRVPR